MFSLFGMKEESSSKCYYVMFSITYVYFRFNCTDEDVLAHLDYLKPPIVGLKKTRSIATIQYDCDFLVAINHFINNGFTRPDIMSSKVNIHNQFY